MRCLAELPMEQREVIVLKIWHRYTFEEIGQLLEISPNTPRADTATVCKRSNSNWKGQLMKETAQAMVHPPPSFGGTVLGGEPNRHERLLSPAVSDSGTQPRLGVDCCCEERKHTFGCGPARASGDAGAGSDEIDVEGFCQPCGMEHQLSR